MTRATLIDELQIKLKALNETLWEDRAPWPHVEKWMKQFQATPNIEDDEQLQMLFLASHFMYFGVQQIRALLRSLFRDLYKYNLVAQIRHKNADTKDRKFIEQEFQKELAATRFLGVGNPSESGSHLLYYFRQESRLNKECFINSHEIFSRDGVGVSAKSKVRDLNIRRYVFIDDLCGSGSQATTYTKDLVQPLKDLDPAVRVSYYPLFATSFGLAEVRKLGSFDDVSAVVELDETFKCFSTDSRVYKNEREPFDRAKSEDIARRYGTSLTPSDPLGWRDGQLLIGFCHNTPDNTLPIVWFEEPDGTPWTPLFKRYPKQYGWET